MKAPLTTFSLLPLAILLCECSGNPSHHNHDGDVHEDGDIHEDADVHEDAGDSDSDVPDTNADADQDPDADEPPAAGITVDGNQFFFDERPFDLWGIRTASATMNQEATTDHLIAQLDDYRAHAVNTVTVFYMGSSGGNYDPFSSDGLTIDEGHQQRMVQIIEACSARDMVVIVGIFYQHAALGLENAEAVRNATRTVTASLRPFRNVIINIANEQNSGGWTDTVGVFDFQDTACIIELCQIIHSEDPERLVGGGGYNHENNEIIGASPDVDVLLFDTLGGEDSGTLYNRFLAAGVTDKPIVNVELFGSWSTNPVPGVFSDSKKQEYYDEVDAAISRDGLSVFFHASSWCQGERIRYELGGQGTSSDPGIRWFFDYVVENIGYRSQ